MLIRSRNSILMVGAGLSATIYPPWSKLIKDLEKECKSQNPDFPSYENFKGANSNYYLEYADEVKKCLHPVERYYSFIHDTFEPTSNFYEDYHITLCKMLIQGLFRAITTTNYDLLLENALATIQPLGDLSVCISKTIESRSISQFLQSMNDDTILKKVLHLHGKYNDRDSIILCAKEYQEKYGFQLLDPTKSFYEEIKGGKLTKPEFDDILYRHGLVWTNHRKILWALMATRRLVFVGFSMNDPYFQKMFDLVGKDLHMNNSETHYLILRITKKNKLEAMDFAKKMQSKFGIVTVFYEDDNQYKGLSKFIEELWQDVSPDERPLILAEATPSKQPTEELNNTANYLLELSKKGANNGN